MDDRRNGFPYGPGWQKTPPPFPQNPALRQRPVVPPVAGQTPNPGMPAQTQQQPAYAPGQPAYAPAQAGQAAQAMYGAQMLTQGGFKPLTREQKAEAARIALEAGFSFDGYQVVRREFFSHKYDPALTIKGNSITFNNACISKLEDVIYVQVLVNPDAEKLVIRPCAEGARDAVRWCIPKDDKRKSRQITCGLFTSKLYEMMGWESVYRYKLQGTRIDYQGEQLYIFDLNSTEAFPPSPKDAGGKKNAGPSYPSGWENGFGMSVDEHAASTQVDLNEGYDYAGVDAGSVDGQISMTEQTGTGADK